MVYKGDSYMDSGYFYPGSEIGVAMPGAGMFKAVFNWVWPIGMLSLGVYFLSGSVLSLIYGGMIGVGAFVLGVRVWAKVNDDFGRRTEELFKEHAQVEAAKQVVEKDVKSVDNS